MVDLFPIKAAKFRIRNVGSQAETNYVYSEVLVREGFLGAYLFHGMYTYTQVPCLEYVKVKIPFYLSEIA